MIHGVQKIELTDASVAEALTDYLQKHFAAGITVTGLTWERTGNGNAYFAQPRALAIEFLQREALPIAVDPVAPVAPRETP